jgi:hypothetical protein
MNRYKTPEEIEAQKKLFSERYPEPTSFNVDPTQPARDFLRKLISATPTPIGESLKEEPKQEFEMSPEIKKYGYDLFGIKDLAGDVEQQIPFAPVEEQPVEMPMEQTESSLDRSLASMEQVIAPQAIPKMPKESAPQMQQPTPEVSPEVSQMEKLSPPKELTEDDLLRQSQEEEDRALLWRQTAKLRDAIMGAGSGTIIKTDESLYDELQKRAQRPLKNLLLSQELKNKKEKNDPNSEISKLAKKALTDLGMNLSEFKNVSYAQLEKLYPSLTNAISTKIAAQARKEEAQVRKDEISLRKLEKAEAKLEKLDEKSKKEASDHIDFAMRQLNKPYAEYEKGRTDLESAKDIVEKVKLGQITPGASDVTLLYTLIRGLDPTSTVRESEIELSKSAMSLWGKIWQGKENVVEGALLDKDTRKSFGEILKTIQAFREKSFARNKAVLVQAGQGKGLNADILENSIYPEFDTKSIRSKKPKEKELTPQERLAKLEEIAIRNQARMDELNSKKGQ